MDDAPAAEVAEAEAAEAVAVPVAVNGPTAETKVQFVARRAAEIVQERVVERGSGRKRQRVVLNPPRAHEATQLEYDEQFMNTARRRRMGPGVLRACEGSLRATLIASRRLQ